MDTLLRLVGRQEWIRFGIRDRFIRQFRNPDSHLGKDFITDFFGFKYKGNTGSFLDWNVYFYGAYEKANLLLFKDILSRRPHAICLDIGANIGHHSLYMSIYSDEVHSFEPNPSVRKKIYEKIKINAVENICVHEVGLGLKDEELPFFEPEGVNKGTGSFIRDYSDNNSQNSECLMLKVANADNYISQLSLDSLDLIKIDVEGFEKYVLEGLEKTLKTHRPIIVVEFSEATKNSFSEESEFYKIFPKNYEVQKITYDSPFLLFLNSSKYRLEKFDFNKPGGDLIAIPSEVSEQIVLGLK